MVVAVIASSGRVSAAESKLVGSCKFDFGFGAVSCADYEGKAAEPK